MTANTKKTAINDDENRPLPHIMYPSSLQTCRLTSQALQYVLTNVNSDEDDDDDAPDVPILFSGIALPNRDIM